MRMLSTVVAMVALFAATASSAQQTRGVYHDWRIRCMPPPNGAADQCALIQSVAGEDKTDLKMTWVVLKASKDQLLMRFVAPKWASPSGLGLKIDNKDVGRVAFAKCDSDTCVAEVPLDEPLRARLQTGQTATLIIGRTSTEMMGIPFSLAGFASGLSALP